MEGRAVTAALALSLPPAPSTHRPSFDARYQAAGEEFLADQFGNDWREHWPELRDAFAFVPIDQEWVDKRTAKLLDWADAGAEVRLIPQHIWHLGTALMQRGDGWLPLWCELARRTPRQWLVQFCGVAMATRDGRLRSLDNHRARSMLVAGVLAWQLAEYDPEGDPDFPFVIRGLPYGSWRYLLSYWEQHSNGVQHCVPSGTAVFGLHRGAGDPMRGECGYIAAWKVAGIAYSLQPAAFTLPAGLRGRWRKNKYDEWEVWGYHELRLRIPLRADEVLAMGPPRPHWASKPRKPPPLELVEDLTPEIEKAERDWLPDEEPAVAELPNELVPMPPTADSASELAEDIVVIAEEDRSGVHEEEPVLSLPASKPLPMWLLPPTAADVEPTFDDGAATVERIRGLLRILADYSGPSRPTTPRTPAVCLADNLAVHRAQGHTSLAQPPETASECRAVIVQGPERGAAIGAPYVEASDVSRPTTSTTPTVYGSGKLTVHRAQEEKPPSPRVRKALERFEAAARARDRGPPDKPPD